MGPMSKVEIVEEERCEACSGRGVIHHSGYYVPGEQFVDPPSEDRCEDCLGTGAREVQEQSRKLERLADALAEADQEQTRADDRTGDTRDGVMAAIEAAGLAPHVCDDDDLPDMVRHALAAAKKLAQPALAPEPGYERIADAIFHACEAAALDIVVAQDMHPVDSPELVLARTLDKAGLIDWSVFGPGGAA
jgi:hypothetical protein